MALPAMRACSQREWCRRVRLARSSGLLAVRSTVTNMPTRLPGSPSNEHKPQAAARQHPRPCPLLVGRGSSPVVCLFSGLVVCWSLDLRLCGRGPATRRRDGSGHHPRKPCRDRIRSLLTCRSQPDGRGCTGDERAVVGCGPASGQDRGGGPADGGCAGAAAAPLPRRRSRPRPLPASSGPAAAASPMAPAVAARIRRGIALRLLIAVSLNMGLLQWLLAGHSDS